MILTFIITFIVGGACAGVALWLRLVTFKKLPRWIVPVAFGGGMLGYSIYAEYTWFGGVEAALPPGIAVVQTVESSAMYQPWTYAVPVTKRFIAADVEGVRRNPSAPGMVIVEIYLYARFAPTTRLPALVDCANDRRADLADTTTFDDNGLPLVDRWIDLSPSDPLHQTVCA